MSPQPAHYCSGVVDGADKTFDADELWHPGTPRNLRHLPRLVGQSVKLVWRAAPRELLVTFALQVIGSATLAGQLLVIRQLLAHLIDQASARQFSSATPSVILLIILLAVSGFVAVVRTELQRLLSELVSWHSMRQVITAATTTNLASFENPAFHDRLQRAIVNASIRPLQMTTGLISVTTSLLGAAAVSTTLIAIQPLFLPLAIVAVVPITLASLRVGRALYRFNVDQTPTDRERFYIQSLLVEKDPAKEIRAYDLGRFLGERFDRLYAGRLAALRRLVRNRIGQGIVGSVLTAVVSGGTLGLLILLVGDGRASLAGAGAAAAALLLLGSQLQSLATGIGQLYESALFLADFSDFVALEPPEAESRATRPGGREVPESHSADEPVDKPARVVLHGVTFTYPSRSEPSLSDVSLEIRPGKVVALVGENGSGKTTLAKLVAGLYSLQAGSITWDGVDVSDLPPGAQRSRTAVLFQDFVHYFLTARENIELGRWERSGQGEPVAEAATRAGAAEILQRLPKGYETYLGPQFFGGSDLSGGQWQRVALARAFFRDAGLVILDEPTAALDPRAEAALFGSVRALFAGRSVLLISHRFASVRMADAIYVLDGGRIVEHGAHAELMQRGGLYAELFTIQASAFGFQRP
jgi:ATP-binding cassette subfamily B protein